jgi:alpha-1,2-mannosyltransferase
MLRFHTGRFPVDLAVYREAGRVILHGGDPYAPTFGRHLRIPLPFTYPPFSALASLVTDALPAGLMLAAWTGLSLVLLLAVGWMVIRPPMEQLGVGGGVGLGLAFGALAWTVPVALTLNLGQVNLVLLAACILDCTRTSKHRGVLVGLSTAIKLTPGVFILYFAVTRQWAAALRAAGTALVCGLLAAVLFPHASNEYWFHLVFHMRRIGKPTYYSNQSILGVLDRLHAPPWVWPPLALVVGVIGLRRAMRAHEEGFELAAVALVGLTTLLVSPISWLHHAVWIIPALGVLLAWATRPERLWLVAGALAVFIIPLPSLGHRMLVHHIVPVVGTLLQNSYALAYLVLLLLLPFAWVGMQNRERYGTTS